MYTKEQAPQTVTEEQIFCQIETTQDGNRPMHYESLSAEFKYAAIHRYYNLGDDVEYISREIRYSRQSIYAWCKEYLKQGIVGLMSKAKRTPRADYRLLRRRRGKLDSREQSECGTGQHNVGSGNCLPARERTPHHSF